MRELWHSARGLVRRPVLAAAALLSLGLGIGVLSASWWLVDAVLVRPLPYPKPRQLVMLWERSRDGATPQLVTSWANFSDWREACRTCGRSAAFSVFFPSATGGDHPEKLTGALVSADFFGLLGVAPLRGRVFGKSDDLPGAPHVVVLSEGLWRRRFAGDPRIVGKAMELDGVAHTIVGVMPAAFLQPEPIYHGGQAAPCALWKPLGGEAAALPRAQRFLRVVARLPRGVSPAAAAAELDGIARRLEREHPREDEGMGIAVVPLAEQLAGPARPALLALLAGALAVWLATSANVSALLIASALSRRREEAVRGALGAGLWRLLLPRLGEALWLGLGGGVLGGLLALLVLRGLLLRLPEPLPRGAEPAAGPRALALLAAVAAGGALLAAAGPALVAARAPLAAALRRLDPRMGGAGRAMSLLVVAELALALPLVFGAGLLGKSLAKLAGTPPGFDGAQVWTLQLELPSARFPKAEDLRRAWGELAERVRSTPGVRSAGLTSSLPLSGRYDLTRELTVPGARALTTTASYRAVSPGYWEALGIPLLAGRPPSERDRAGGPPVAWINQAMARAYWPAGGALGSHVLLGATSREVVGIVGDVRHQGLELPPVPELSVPLAQAPLRFATLAARFDAAGGEATSAPGETLRAAVAGYDRDLAAAEATPMAALIARALAGPRFQALLAALLAAVTGVLAAVGTYGLTSLGVQRRDRELALRAALGASPRDLRREALAEAARSVLGGLALGLAGAFAVGRLLGALLIGVSRDDPGAWVAAPLVLLAVAGAAVWLPARRAARSDPAAVLRQS